ncbi:MAG: class I SAM-dependent methyltransferase [Candidatus Buchananbacteria bacterium]
MKPETIEKILKQTQDSYDNIADDFDQTRSYLWPGLLDFKKFVKPGDKILDLGCGNGKLRLLFKDVKIDYSGLDKAQKLLDIAQNKSEFALASQQFFKGDAYNLPFADNTFDTVFFIAVLHHLPSKELRLKSLQEINRVLKPGGTLIMTNWNRYQAKGLQLKYIIKYTWLKLIGQSELDFKDIYLPWMKGKDYRYYHAFTLGELKKLVNQSGLKLDQNYLAYWRGQKAGFLNYLKASNLVTIAKKC